MGRRSRKTKSQIEEAVIESQTPESSVSKEIKDLTDSLSYEYKTAEQKEADLRKALRREAQKKKKQKEAEEKKDEVMDDVVDTHELRNTILENQEKELVVVEEEENLLIKEQKERISRQLEEESKKLIHKNKKQKEAEFKKMTEEANKKRHEEFSKIKDVEKEKEKERVKQQLLLLSQQTVGNKVQPTQPKNLMHEFLSSNDDEIVNKLSAPNKIHQTKNIISGDKFAFVLTDKTYTVDVNFKTQTANSQIKLLDDDEKDIHLQIRYTNKNEIIVAEFSNGKWSQYQKLSLKKMSKYLLTIKCCSNGNVELKIPGSGNFSIKRKTNKIITKMIWTFDDLKLI
jgi:hypothetical protein